MLDKFKQQLVKNSEVYLKIKARPGAGKTQVKEIRDDGSIKINLAKPPDKGKANQELIKFLAQEFGLNDNNVKIVSGAKGRLKIVKIVK